MNNKMKKKYDGWAIKTQEGNILLWSVSDTRTEIVQKKAGMRYWRARKKRGWKIVKIKLVEVNDEK